MFEGKCSWLQCELKQDLGWVEIEGSAPLDFSHPPTRTCWFACLAQVTGMDLAVLASCCPVLIHAYIYIYLCVR